MNYYLMTTYGLREQLIHQIWHCEPEQIANIVNAVFAKLNDAQVKAYLDGATITELVAMMGLPKQ